ncbi:hypothetical protein SEMRO_3535_G349050.1 [Seminavis robusta]|uniref:Uncharacterized protein n=1 Tax=Seminavis robusta TaxID=568900 RepID=A0A9N8F0H7_9STRA|nr:hypothetical protein SEMRO_3535_G349050.1 [Seminavis robusta]|eukprot:Sro3535_g349050.1 n/a (215) ;mRNA; r:3020-3664
MDQNNTPMIHYLLIFLGVEPRTVRLMRDVFGVVDINHLGLFLCEFFNESPHGINASNYEVSVDAIFEGDYWLVKKLVYFFLHFTAFAATLEALNCSRGERALSFYLGYLHGSRVNGDTNAFQLYMESFTDQNPLPDDYQNHEVNPFLVPLLPVGDAHYHADALETTFAIKHVISTTVYILGDVQVFRAGRLNVYNALDLDDVLHEVYLAAQERS